MEGKSRESSAPEARQEMLPGGGSEELADATGRPLHVA